MDILQAIRWANYVYDINSDGEYVKKDREVQQEINLEIKEEYSDLEKHTAIRSLMDINNLLNPADEEVRDTEEDLVEHIIACHQESTEVDDEGDDYFAERVPPTWEEGIAAVDILRRLEECREGGSQEVIRKLNCHEHTLRVCRKKEQKQSHITEFLGIEHKSRFKQLSFISNPKAWLN
ncbi:hypothetical protein KEM56_007506 [Ascosphaera pollenicola]|nr:hypothetical protein KEM56_007506 [Ascosphaera pollenicola]